VRPIAVLDSSVVVAGIGWRGGDARSVLVLLAQRAFVSVRTSWLTTEWAEVTERVTQEVRWENPNWANWLEWLKRASLLVDQQPAKRIARDAKDDPVLAAALSGAAHYLVAYDKDLLDLGKPYGVACVTPRAFLSAVLSG
jgi:putative PIN family toxin of toxin-antitoxin system